MNTSTATTPRTVAFLGLGVMGHPMAGHLVKAGHRVTVYNRTAAKAAAWAAEHGGAHAPTPREAAAGADVVCACVGNDDDLRSVTLGEDGAFAGMKPGAVFVDHTTASAEVARELHAAALARGLHFIDAPVSGGQAGAVNGVLTIMCGGEDEPFAAAQPVVMAYARACTLLGPSGSGQLAKMVNQVCIAGLVQGLAEALAWTCPRCWTSSARARPRAGRWTTAARPCWSASSTSVSRSTGCAKTSASCSKRRGAMALSCR
jgi:3-hydroxyisobutyrate dehydrogenase